MADPNETLIEARSLLRAGKVQEADNLITADLKEAAAAGDERALQAEPPPKPRTPEQNTYDLLAELVAFCGNKDSMLALLAGLAPRPEPVQQSNLMGNVWGIANPWPLPVTIFAGSDVACNAGVETQVMTTGAMTAVGPGNYYPIVMITMAISCGATPPTACQCAFKIGAGSDVDSASWPAGVLVANQTSILGVVLAGVASGSQWIGAGGTINVTVQSTAQAVTWRFTGSRGQVFLFRGPDQ